MRVILCGLIEEIVAVGKVMLARRRSGRERRLHALGVVHLERTIHLIGRDVVEALALVALGQRLPVELRGLEQRKRAHHVGAGKGEGVLDAAVHVALGSKMNNAIHLLLLHQTVESVEVADVHLHKLIVGPALKVFQVGEIARVGELIEANYVILGIFVHKKAHHMAANKPGTAGNNNRSTFHIFLNSLIFETFQKAIGKATPTTE